MKKLGFIISALAIVLGFAQCAKKPNMPTINGNFESSTRKIVFSVNGGDGQKGDFGQVDKVLDYTWANGDEIHVYSSNETVAENNMTDFSEGHYCGVLNLTDGANTKAAKFSGMINVPDDTKTLRFVHYGSGVEVEKKEEGVSGSASFATQDGGLNSVSSKVVALCDKAYASDKEEYAVDALTVQFAVVKFSFEKFEGNENVILNNIAKAGLKVNANGTVEYTDGTSSTLSSMEDNKTEYYTVFMPKSETKYKFSCGTRFANKKAGIDAGIFYSKNDVGDAIVLDLMPEGTVPGEYSVSTTTKVYFSQGNLQYIGSADTPYWKFATNQWDVIGEAQGNGNEKQDRDLFGWGTSGHEPADDEHFLFYRPWDTYRTETQLHETNYFGFGPSNNKKPDAPAGATTTVGDITNSYHDWGVKNPISNGGNTPGTWRTMTKDEWEFLLGRKSTGGDYMSYPCRVKVGGDYVNGYLILSDDNESKAISKNVFDSWSETPSFETMPEDAAFLPMAGYRKGTEVSEVGNECRYQSTTHAEPEDHKGGRYNYNANFRYDVCSVNDNPRCTGRSVRLVQDIK